MHADERNPLDEQLKELALVAQQHPIGTKEGRMALTQLVSLIWRSGKLCHPCSGQFQAVYKDIYDEAVQTLFFYICKDDNIRKYDPERASVMSWVNMLLTRRFFPEAIPKIVRTENEINLGNSDLELLESSEPISLSEQVRQCIEDDPEGIFRNEHIRGYPEANFQAIAIRRYSGVSWKEISAEWDIELKSLNTFYQRCLKKLAPKFKEYL
jgi:DNA-directed RNA polymerase specialized sigma24 family protein